MKDYKLEQQAYRDLVRPKFYPRGTKIKYTTRKGVESEYTNALGAAKHRKWSDPKYTKKRRK